jgi:DNA-binding transcriptional MocR family regulator
VTRIGTVNIRNQKFVAEKDLTSLIAKMSEPISYGQYTIPGVEECVNFGVGQPAPTMLPLAAIRKASAEKFAEDDPLFLQASRALLISSSDEHCHADLFAFFLSSQYGYISGYAKFRKSLATFLAAGYNKRTC